MKPKTKQYLVNYHVRDREQEAVASALDFARFTPAWVSPKKGVWVSAFPAPAESHDNELLNRIGRTLSRTLDTYVLSTLLHDSRSFLYTIFLRGEIAAEFDSFPELTGVKSSSYRRLTDGKPRLLHQLCPSPVEIEQVEKLLYRKPLAEAVSELVSEEKVSCEEELMEKLPEDYLHQRILEKRGWAEESDRLCSMAALLNLPYPLFTFSAIEKKKTKKASAPNWAKKGFVYLKKR